MDAVRRPPSRWPAEAEIGCLDTGVDTPTGERLHRAAPALESEERFCLAYADGVADIDLARLLDYHRGHGQAATMAVVQPRLPFGVARLDGDGSVLGFTEKPRSELWVNAGFFCFERAALEVLEPDSTLEREPLEQLSRQAICARFATRGFWECMDTYKDWLTLEEVWAAGRPWVAKLKRHVRSLQMAFDQAQEGRRRRAARPALHQAGARDRVAAREGGGDPDGNSALALAIQKARDASMPKDNIERAIAKGTGEGADMDQIETVLYEGYGPGGVALLIEALTDNRNRTGAELRHLLGKHGGNLGEPGSVSYLFDKRGVIVVDANRYGEDDLMPAIDAGAEDIALDEDVFEVITEPSDLDGSARGARPQAGVEIESADLTQRPRARVPVDESDAAKLMKLIDALEESDDVGAVHANFDVDSAVLERVAQ